MKISQLNIGKTILFVLLAVFSMTGVNTYARSLSHNSDVRIAESGSPEPQRSRGRHAGPPQEAIDACEGFGESEACDFTSPRGDEISGTCEYLPGDQFACVPEGGPAGGRRPPEDTPPADR